MKFVRFFSNFSTFQLAMVNLLLCSTLVYTACRKDTGISEQTAAYSSKISLQEVKRAFESGQLGTLALGATPAFTQSIERKEGGTDFLLTPIAKMDTEASGKMGVNLVFYRDIEGKLQHFAALWRTNATSLYPSQWVPFKGDVAFSGDVTWINAQNVVLGATKFDKGQTQRILPVQQSLSSLMGLVSPNKAAQDRGPELPDLSSWSDIQRFWRQIDLLYHDMFGGGASSGSGGGSNVTNTSDPHAQYVNNFLVTCSSIKAWIVAGEQTLETYPYGPNEERVDYRLCQFIDELTPYAEGNSFIFYCLWKNYLGTGLLESILMTWEQSDKSAATATLLVQTLAANLNCQ